MKIYCDYHPTKLAQWECPDCEIALCPSCVETRKESDMPGSRLNHFCPKCNTEAEWLGVSNIIEPFWKRLHKFFIYALLPTPLFLNIALSIGSLIASYSLWLTLIIWIISYKYAFAILMNTGRGNLIPPKADSRTVTDDISPVFKQLLMFIVIGFVLYWIFSKFGFYLGVISLIFTIYFIPSIIIMFVATENLSAALNPLLFVRLAFRIGWGYLLMYFFLILLLIAPSAFAALFLNLLPAVLQTFLACFAKNLYMFISYHLMGYVLLQYHEDIGYNVEYDDFQDQLSEAGNKEEDERTKMLNKIDFHIKEGQFDEVLAIIREEKEKNGIDDIELSERYFKLLKMKKMAPEMLKHGNIFLQQLAKENRKEQACEVYSQCNQVSNNFTPPSPLLLNLGSWFKETGKPKAAIGAYSKFAKAYPKDPMVPKAYFLAAQIYNEKLKDSSKAKTILNGLLKKYPDHEIISFVQNYLTRIP